MRDILMYIMYMISCLSPAQKSKLENQNCDDNLTFKRKTFTQQRTYKTKTVETKRKKANEQLALL